MRDERHYNLQHKIRKAAHWVIFAQLTALLLVGNAAFTCFAAGETVLTCVMEGPDENGNLGMRIEVSADPDVEAYDLDVLYDMRSVKVESVEEKCGQPKAFEYKDYDRDGILRVVGLVGEVIVGEKTLLHISWKPVSEEDVNYVPTLAVRDLVDEAGEDIPFTIVYEDAGGSAITPSPAKLNVTSAGDGDANGGTSASQEEKEGSTGPDTGMQQDAGDEEREDVDQAPSEAGQNGTSGSGNDAAGESKKSNEGSESAGESGDSSETRAGKGHDAVAGIGTHGAVGESGTDKVQDDGSGNGIEAAGESVTENVPDDSSVPGLNGADERSAMKKAGGLKIDGENGKAAEEEEVSDADGIAGRAAFTGIAAALVLGGLYYNRRKRT